ncbi:MAG: hypothetical protein ABJO29_08495 [Yoonia sp.]|uniref:hypothetical protein n=1 Tax=Yoonia sp. TaxID=2212373 RepID=UPI0032665843
MTNQNQTELDDLLGQTAQIKPTVPSDLMARVLIDAAQVQPRNIAPSQQTLWGAVLDMIGGWPAIGGIAMAGVAGLWIGVAPPVGLEDMATTVLGSTQTVDLFGGDMLGNFSDGVDG